MRIRQDEATQRWSCEEEVVTMERAHSHPPRRHRRHTRTLFDTSTKDAFHIVILILSTTLFMTLRVAVVVVEVVVVFVVVVVVVVVILFQPMSTKIE